MGRAVETSPFTTRRGQAPTRWIGRVALRDQVAAARDRVVARRFARSLLVHGDAGSGKTAVLHVLSADALDDGWQVVQGRVGRNGALASWLVPALRGVAAQLSPLEPPQALTGLGDYDLLVAVLGAGASALRADTSVCVVIDDLHQAAPTELAALLRALHRVNQRGLPVLCVAAGDDTILRRAGDAQPDAEMLCVYPRLDPLSPAEVADGLTSLFADAGCEIEDRALARLVALIDGSPTRLQQLGARVSAGRRSGLITLDVVAVAGA